MLNKKSLTTFKTVLSGVRIPWLLIAISLGSSFIMANSMIRSAVITAQVIDSSGNINTNDLTQYIVYTLCAGLFAVVGTYVNNLLTEKINLGVRTKLWKKMLKLPLAYYDRESGESLVSRVTTDCNQASDFIGVLIQTVNAIYALYLAVKSMYEFSAELTLWSIILVPIVAICVSLCGKLVYKTVNKFFLSRSKTTEYLLERVKNLRLIRSSNMVETETNTGNGHFSNLFKTGIKYTLADSLMSCFIGITPVGLIIITFIIGGIQVASGHMSTGVVIGFYSVSGLASVRINTLITAYGSFMAVNGTFEKISNILTEEEETFAGRSMDLPDDDIIINNMKFAYNEKEILKGISCVIPKSKSTAIIGNNGAGKSTLFKLLERMYEPSSGEIMFGSIPVTDFNPVTWRKAFALVSQDRPLLSGTVRDNITYGCNRKVTDDELEKVSKQANIWELIQSLPDGFDTYVEPNGSNFSGGQRQCIAIARAIMRNPEYLLLDEATSNLDAKSEKIVSEALANLMNGRTTIMIAHSLSAISNADNVIVLKDGKVESSGTVEEVSQSSSVFRDFMKSQVMAQEV